MHSSPVSLIEMALEIIHASEEGNDLPQSLRGKLYAALVLLCSEQVSSPEELVSLGEAGENARLFLSLSLLAIAKEASLSYAIGRLAAARMLRELGLLSMQNDVVGEQTDVWRCSLVLTSIIQTNKQPNLLDPSTHPSQFQNEQLRRRVEELELIHQQPAQKTGTSKKRKVSSDEANLLQSINNAIYETLSLEGTPSELLFPDDKIVGALEYATESTSCTIVNLLGYVGCASDAAYNKSTNHSAIECSICENSGQGKAKISLCTSKSTVRSIFSKLVRQRTFLESRQTRIVAMIALRKLVFHCEDGEFIDLEVSSAAQWCLQSLNSSIRELRIAAGRTLSTFMPSSSTPYINTAALVRNRKNSIALLRSASEQDLPHMVESRIMVWGQIGKIVTEEELNLVLIKLLDYLGSNNTVEAAVAFNELLNVADTHRMPPRRLLEPFWNSLAYMVVKDMIQRPQRSRAIAELLQVSINDLLLLIQSHALPWLVLDRQKDVIQKIAEARGEKEIWGPIMDIGNLPSVLSLLMLQESDDIETFTKSRLNDVSSHFHSLPLLDLVQAEQTTLATELLKAAAEGDESRKQKVSFELYIAKKTNFY